MASFNDLEYCYSQENTVTEEKLVAWETEMELKIPQQYRDFLLIFKAGVPRFNRFAYYSLGDYYDDGSIKHALVTEFFTTLCEDDGPAYDVAGQFFGCYGEIPDWLLPFTNDAAGSYICIAHKGENEGKVYYWNRDYYSYDRHDPNEDTLTLLTSSFNKFVQKVQFYEK
ncbi:MAG: SMI1/KNR4 family protein [Chthonomonadaceae bacterium]|nr:SMI1/KNR4 family protein [Chthonomonadaceae bacterium]